MTYHQNLGASLDTIGDAVQAASQIVEDPFLPEIACHVLRLSRIAAGEDAGRPCPATVVTPGRQNKGVGLSAVSAPLRAFTWMRANPLVAMAIGGAVVGGVFWLGYRHGRNR